MNILEVRKNQKRIVSAIQQAVELAPEVRQEVEFNAYKSMKLTRDYWNAHCFEVYDLETEDIAQTAATQFWKRIGDHKEDDVEEMDAIELFNMYQYGVFGELVYG